MNSQAKSAQTKPSTSKRRRPSSVEVPPSAPRAVPSRAQTPPPSNRASASTSQATPSTASGQGQASTTSKGRARRDKLITKQQVIANPKRVSFLIPDEVASVEVAVIEPGTIMSASEFIETPSPAEEVIKGINCYFVEQMTQLSFMGVPLTDMWFALISMILLLGSNVILLNLALRLYLKHDIRYFYILSWLALDRLVAIYYRCFCSKQRGFLYFLLHIITALTYMDISVTAISLIYQSNGSYVVYLLSLKSATKRKQWIALPFLSAPGRVVTKMKTMCLLSASFQCWQVLGILAGMTDPIRPMTKTENVLIYCCIACSTLLVCWAATCCLPTIPVPQLFTSGYYVVVRISVKMLWLTCTAASRIIAFYMFSTAFSYLLLFLGSAQWVLLLVISLLLKYCCSAPDIPRPSFVKLLLTTSIYNLVFVHPQKAHLNNAYGIVYFFYLCENLIVMYATLEYTDSTNMVLVFASVGLYAVGMFCFLVHIWLHMARPHQVVRIDKRENMNILSNSSSIVT